MNCGHTSLIMLKQCVGKTGKAEMWCSSPYQQLLIGLSYKIKVFRIEWSMMERERERESPAKLSLWRNLLAKTRTGVC